MMLKLFCMFFWWFRCNLLIIGENQTKPQTAPWWKQRAKNVGYMNPGHFDGLKFKALPGTGWIVLVGYLSCWMVFMWKTSVQEVSDVAASREIQIMLLVVVAAGRWSWAVRSNNRFCSGSSSLWSPTAAADWKLSQNRVSSIHQGVRFDVSPHAPDFWISDLNFQNNIYSRPTIFS